MSSLRKLSLDSCSQAGFVAARVPVECTSDCSRSDRDMTQRHELQRCEHELAGVEASEGVGASNLLTAVFRMYSAERFMSVR